MGEDSCRNNAVDKKSTVVENHITNGVHHNNSMNGSAISSCSEADSESTTCIGDMNDHTMDDQDYQYGPGIVSKLRTKFLSISLKQNRCGNNMRRSCSLENILDQKTAMSPTNIFSSTNRSGEPKSTLINPTWSNLKRAKSMDTLLLSLAEEQQSKIVNHEVCTTPEIGLERVPKIIRRKDGPLTRTTLTICDEELPKPDTVKTYKRMFEPAESKKTSGNSNVRRRPPVLRATAKSGSTSVSKSTGSSGKMNGVLPNSLPAVKPSPVSPKCEQSAKESNISKECSPKVISNALKNEFKILEDNRNAIKNAVNGKKDIPIVNGVVKAEPIRFKQKDEPSKRNFRVHKHLDTERGVKPAIPPNKPSVHPKTITTIAQILEKRNSMDKIHLLPKQIIPKTEKLEKITLKPILAKHTDKSSNLNIVNKLERHQSPTPKEINSTIIQPIVENGIPPILKEITHQNNVQEESQPVLNGFSTVDTPDAAIIAAEPPQKHLSTSKKEVSNNLVLQNGDGQKEVVCKANPVRSSSIANNQNSMVFDFRGKNVEAHLAIIPAPFGCRKAVPTASKKRGVLLDGKEPYAINGFSNGDTIGTDEDDDDFMDYSTPQPCGLVFEGENIKIGKGAILARRNKDLKIQFDEDVEKNTFVYPSESSYLSDDSSSISSSDFSSLEETTAKLTNGVVLPATTAKLRANTAIGTNGVGGLMSYTPSVLRTVDNFQPGIFRAPEKEDQKLKEKKDSNEGEEENRERKEEEQNGVADDSEEDSTMLKPADPEFISSWSLSANTSDLLF